MDIYIFQFQFRPGSIIVQLHGVCHVPIRGKTGDPDGLCFGTRVTETHGFHHSGETGMWVEVDD
jgi:hypothetical protein